MTRSHHEWVIYWRLWAFDNISKLKEIDARNICEKCYFNDALLDREELCGFGYESENDPNCIIGRRLRASGWWESIPEQDVITKSDKEQYPGLAEGTILRGMVHGHEWGQPFNAYSGEIEAR